MPIFVRNEKGRWECPLCKYQYPLESEIAPRHNCQRRKTAVKRPPNLRRKLESYAKSVRRWHQAGRPHRSDAEVAELFDACCTPCEEFDAAGNSCRVCGCKVRRGGLVLLGGVEIRSGFVNKLKMATEHCPLGKW